jgi:hypothetical protein
MMGSNRKDKSLEMKMNRTINSELNSGISGKNLSEFSIKFEGLSDTFSRNEMGDIDDGKEGDVVTKGKDLQGRPFMYKTDKFSRKGVMSQVQRSKSATNQTKKIIQSDIQDILKNSLHDKRKTSVKKKDAEKQKMQKLSEFKEKRSLGSTKVKRKRSGDTKKSKLVSDKNNKYSSKDVEKDKTLQSKKGVKIKKKKKKIFPKSGMKKSSNTNSDKKLRKLEEKQNQKSNHKKSFSVTTPSQFKKIFKELNKGSKNQGKYSQTEKNSLHSKASSSYIDSKEPSLRGNSNKTKNSQKNSRKNQKLQKSKFNRTDISSESDPKSQNSNKKTTHKSHPSKDDSKEKVSLENKRKNLINPTFISPKLKIKGSLDKEESFQRDENFESFAMINEGIPGAKFDSFINHNFADLKDVLRTTQDERGVRLDNGMVLLIVLYFFIDFLFLLFFLFWVC